MDIADDLPERLKPWSTRDPEAQTVPAEKSAALTSLRLQRKLTVEDAAKKAALWPEQVEWLEEGRLYRFPGYEAAVTALLRYATALGIDHREARRLSGMPVEPPPPRQLGRWIAQAPPPRSSEQRSLRSCSP